MTVPPVATASAFHGLTAVASLKLGPGHEGNGDIPNCFIGIGNLGYFIFTRLWLVLQNGDRHLEDSEPVPNLAQPHERKDYQTVYPQFPDLATTYTRPDAETRKMGTFLFFQATGKMGKMGTFLIFSGDWAVQAVSGSTLSNEPTPC